MELNFQKYQATGNDFVIIDDRSGEFPRHDISLISNLCHRRYGIGADGLILIQSHPSVDFRMVYFNADGREGSLCGNGARAAVAFANRNKIIQGACKFYASDGLHEAQIDKKEQVSLSMNNVQEVNFTSLGCEVNTGSPHLIIPWAGLDNMDVVLQGRAIRYNDLYREQGINVNFVSYEGESGSTVRMRTYERGVEDETFACGTGAVAAALVAAEKGWPSPVNIETLGGTLVVSFQKNSDGSFNSIALSGPAKFVFAGTLEI